MIALIGVGVLGVRVLARLPPTEQVLLVDHDVITQRNVPSQYPQHTVGMTKVVAAQRLLRADAQILASHIDVTSIGLLSGASLIIDCTDNMHSRLLLNDYCKEQGIPLLHCALSDTAGTVMLLQPDGPCLRCVYRGTPGETCTPQLPLALADATAQAAIAELARADQRRRMVRLHGDSLTEYEIAQDPACPCCAGNFAYLRSAHPYYITYCANAGCMAAKPIRQRQVEHGEPQHMSIRGVSCLVFPNGEIHFLGEQDEDMLCALAEQIYAQQK